MAGNGAPARCASLLSWHVTFAPNRGISFLGYAVRGLLSGLRLSNGSPVVFLLVPLRPSMKPCDALNSPGLPFRGARDANSWRKAKSFPIAEMLQ